MLHLIPLTLAAYTLIHHLSHRRYRLAALTAIAGCVLAGCAVYSGV